MTHPCPGAAPSVGCLQWQALEDSRPTTQTLFLMTMSVCPTTAKHTQIIKKEDTEVISG